MYVPAGINEIVVIVADPVVLAAPGALVNVHPPVGKSLKTTLPVARPQVGWVIVPTVGASGVIGCGLITTFADGTEVHSMELVTLNV